MGEYEVVTVGMAVVVWESLSRVLIQDQGNPDCAEVSIRAVFHVASPRASRWTRYFFKLFTWRTVYETRQLSTFRHCCMIHK